MKSTMSSAEIIKRKASKETIDGYRIIISRCFFHILLTLYIRSCYFHRPYPEAGDKWSRTTFDTLRANTLR